MRIKIGKYKDNDVVIESLHMSDTYLGYGDGPASAINKDLVPNRILERAKRLFGGGVPIHIVDLDKLDYSRPLPGITVFVDLVCWIHIKDTESSHSRMTLVWFQKSDQDPFAMAKEKFEEADWEKQAVDCEL